MDGKKFIISKESNTPSEIDGAFTVYILRTSSNTLYIGQTNDLEKRLHEHKNKTAKSAKYMKYFESFTLVYVEKYSTRNEAMRREWQLKQWSRSKKDALIQGKNTLLKNSQP